MLSEDRKFDFAGSLTLQRSRVLDIQSQPKDDKVNWLFLQDGAHQFSFVYKIEKPLEAEYGKSFTAKIAFTMIEDVKNVIHMNQSYEVLRGSEIIGTIILVSAL